MSQPAPRSTSLLSLFWTPIVAVGSAYGSRLNAQISVSTLGASIVPSRPRLLVILYKTNYTHELARASGRLALTILSRDQIDLVHRLGFSSGRDRDKLEGLAYRLTAAGNPVFEGGLGWLDCRVIERFDLGDSTAHLVAVVEQGLAVEGEPLVWSALRLQLPPEWQAEWDAKIARDMQQALSVMRWLPQ